MDLVVCPTVRNHITKETSSTPKDKGKEFFILTQKSFTSSVIFITIRNMGWAGQQLMGSRYILENGKKIKFVNDLWAGILKLKSLIII